MTELDDNKNCSFLIFNDRQTTTVKQIRTKLENGNDEERYEALKELIMMHLNGQPQPGLLMVVVRYMLPTRYKPSKKLLSYYWEIYDKSDKDGNLLSEIMLLSSHFRSDLTHPNEYIRGCTLRFLCKVKEVELLETLIAPVVANLEDRHAYVRRNAVLCVYSTYQTASHLIPDAPDLIEQFLMNETDLVSKRNAFIMLFDCDQEKAVKYLRYSIKNNEISTSSDSFQLVILNLLRKLCKTNPSEKAKYLKVISSLIDTKSYSVMYQCASTLVSVSSIPVVIKAAATCYTKLLLSPTNSNVKLITLDRLSELKDKYPSVMEKSTDDLLRAMTAPDMEFKKKILQIVMDLVSIRNVESIMTSLKKEITSSKQMTSQSREIQKEQGEYRKILIKSFHQTALKFPETGHYVLSLFDFMDDVCAIDVLLFAREVAETTPKLRKDIIQKICDRFNIIVSARVYRVALWILGEYSETNEEIDVVFSTLKENILSGGLYAEEQDDNTSLHSFKTTSSLAKTTVTTGTNVTSQKVRADGTYVTQSALDTPSAGLQSNEKKKPNIQRLVLDGSHYLASVVCSTVSKLCVRVSNSGKPENEKNLFIAEGIRIMCYIVQLVSSEESVAKLDTDTLQRIKLLMKLVSKPNELTTKIFTEEIKAAFSNLITEKREKEKHSREEDEKQNQLIIEPDALFNFTQLKGKRGIDSYEIEEEEVTKATLNVEKNSHRSSKLSRVTQLTGFSDAVYAEALVTVHQFDILLDVLVVNQSENTLQNLTLELATVGDLKLCERPQTYTIEPLGSKRIKANIKVSSTETGIIFGNIVYDISGKSGESKCVVLNDLNVDIMDYIAPAVCDDTQFRSMWFEFEWENKIPISSSKFSSLLHFLRFISSKTNMQCLTSEEEFKTEDCQFLSANLYARSTFGEDALANVSVERDEDNNKIEGFIRIRSKTQGIALSLGNIINSEMKKLEAKSKSQ